MDSKNNVLIVDDDENICKVLQRDLKRLRYSCATADGGEAAIEKLAGNDFDVALIDLLMPKVGGLDVLRAIDEMGIDTVPIILSGHKDISQAVAATKLGAFDYLAKPASLQTIQETIERALRHRRIVRHAHAMSRLAAQWEATFDASADMIVVLTPDHRILRANRAVAERLHCNKHDLTDRDCHEALCGNDHPRNNCPQTRSVELSQESWGGDFEITSAPLRNTRSEVWGWMHIARDITERKRAEEDLRRAHVETALMVASISSILVALDKDGRVSQWNVAAETAFGIDSKDAIGRKLSDCSIDWGLDAISAAMKECTLTNSPVRVDDIRFTRTDGKQGLLCITLNPMIGEGTEHWGILILGRDMTELKLLEAQLTQAQKLEGIGQLAAGIAHEINTPMQYVGDNTRFLKECFDDIVALLREYASSRNTAAKETSECESFDSSESCIKDIDLQYLIDEIPNAIEQSLEGVRHVTRIVGAMREFSHPGSEEKTIIDLNKAIESTITVSRSEWKYIAEMRTDFDPDLPPVPCLPAELNQVILNLIINAAHAISDVVRDGPDEKGAITISTRRDGDWVEIRVIDTGTGIPQEIQPNVFDPFFTTKDVGRGTGQGLAIAHSVVTQKHSGTIRFETEAGQGTTFIIRLPVQTLSPKDSPRELKETADVP